MTELNQLISYLLRTTVGFDYLTNTLTNKPQGDVTFPPYNIVKKGDETSIIVALAGYAPSDIEVVVNESNLLINSLPGTGKSEDEGLYLHRGIAKRQFRLGFTLGRYVEVKEASFVNGILSVKLTQVIPEEKKPKQITIISG